MGMLLSDIESQFLAVCERKQTGLTKIIKLAVRNRELEARNIELE